MSDTELYISVQTNISTDEVIERIARDLSDDEVLAFLVQLDERMASWDFTLKAAEFFTRSGLKMTEAPGRPLESGAVARVGEFLRQAEIQPHVGQMREPIMGVWTDPSAEYVKLDPADLNMVIQLAVSALRGLPEVTS